MLSIQELYVQVQGLAGKIGAAPQLFPTFGTSDLTGRPYVVIKGDTCYYLANDRDTIVVNRQTTDDQELLYWIFEAITYQMGCAYEAEHRVPDVDHRRLAFKKQLDLLETLQPDWKERRQQEIREVLEKHPYRDPLKR